MQTRKLYQKVAADIAEKVENGTYGPGQRLPGERDLAEEYGVSRPTIREAMIALEIRGLVEARHGSGLYVTLASPAETPALELDIGAFELMEARILFESETAALAATTISDEAVEEIAQAVRDMDREESGDMRVEQADRRFHVGIAAATNNSAIRSIIETLWDLRYRSPLSIHMFARARRKGVNPRSDEHQLILDALRKRDPVAARDAMRRHLRRVVEDLLEATEMEALERARSESHSRRSELARRFAI